MIGPSAFVTMRVPRVVAELYGLFMARQESPAPEPDELTEDRVRRLQVLQITRGNVRAATVAWEAHSRQAFVKHLIHTGRIGSDDR